MELIKYKLRLLLAENFNLVSEPDRQGESLQKKENLPIEVTVEAERVEIENGIAMFMVGDALVTAMPLESFLWSPLGLTPVNVRMKPFPMKQFGALYPHDFSFHVVVNFTASTERSSENCDSENRRRNSQYRNENIRIFKPANCIVLSGNNYFFVNSNGEYLYSVPANISYFEPLGSAVTNMRIWNMSGESRVVQKSATREDFVAATFAQEKNPGSSGTSGSSGSSGRDGENGTSGSSGSSGISGTSGRDGNNGTSGISGSSGSSGADGTSGSSGSSGFSGTSGLSGSSGSSGSSGRDGSSGTSGADGESGSSGTSGIDGTSGRDGVIYKWQGAWDSTTNYSQNDVVRDNNAVWVAIKENTDSRPSQNPFTWDLMIGNSGDAQLNTMRIFLTSSEISSLKKTHLVLFVPDGKKVMEVVTATMMFYPQDLGNVPSHNIALCMGSSVIGGWSNPFANKSTTVCKATLLEDYKHSVDASLILKSDVEVNVANSKAVIYISYRLLPV